MRLHQRAVATSVDDVIEPRNLRSLEAAASALEVSLGRATYSLVGRDLHVPQPGDPNSMPGDPVEYVVNRETGAGADARTDTVQRDAGVAPALLPIPPRPL